MQLQSADARIRQLHVSYNVMHELQVQQSTSDESNGHQPCCTEGSAGSSAVNCQRQPSQHSDAWPVDSVEKVGAVWVTALVFRNRPMQVQHLQPVAGSCSDMSASSQLHCYACACRCWKLAMPRTNVQTAY